LAFFSDSFPFIKTDKNEFSGSLPSQVGALTKLRWLEIDENNIVGSLPKEIGALTNLITLVAGKLLSLRRRVGSIQAFLTSIYSNTTNFHHSKQARISSLEAFLPKWGL
jgi:Leucine-rich repeat (LRR) protein